MSIIADYRLVYIVHVIGEGEVLRPISAKVAEPAEGAAMKTRESTQVVYEVSPCRVLNMGGHIANRIDSDADAGSPGRSWAGYAKRCSVLYSGAAEILV
ncbi:MAG: hypothetical protein ACRYFU_21290 [Janthinobacterium lividum]